MASASNRGVPGVKVLERKGFVFIDNRLACVAGGDLVVALAVCGYAVLDWRWACRRWCFGGGGGAGDYCCGFNGRSARDANANVVVEPQTRAGCADCGVPFVADGLLDLTKVLDTARLTNRRV